MKKVMIATLLTVCSAGALAQSTGFIGPSDAATTQTQGGFSGPSVGTMTIEQAKTQRDDSHVTLRGYIEKHLGGKNYLFKDQSGSITVEISNKKWNGLTVTPQDLVEIEGEVDKNFNSVEIDVDLIKKVN